MNVLNIEECELLGDSKYRAYISQVEKALKNFEYTSEWADLISALGKLNKVLSSHVKYPIIPKRVTIGKRLAQCLHPALPSGVHLKALETYDIIFKCVGTPRLAQDLFTYSAGLFPLLAYAAMNVKPSLLQLYEMHYVPLGKHIKPALTGLLMGLLPGLEEGSETFDRVSALLDDFCESVEAVYFYGCLWECVLASSSIRLAAINYALSHFNRKRSMEDQIHFMGTNIDNLVEAVCGSVQDSSVLVQRSALDFLLVGFPMHNSQLTRSDMTKVTTAAIKVVLRRDMSLNRRLYAWLLGFDSNGVAIFPEAKTSSVGHKPLERADSISTVSSEPEMDYFSMYSKDLLVQAVKNCIQESFDNDAILDGKPANLRPFRILMSFLDKPEIGAMILEDVLIEIFRCMYRECVLHSGLSTGDNSRRDSVHLYRNGASNGQSRNERRRELIRQKRDEKTMNTEIIKTANLLFGAFEPYFIWDFIGRVFDKVCSEAGEAKKKPKRSEDVSLTELCLLVDFLMDKVSLETYLETQTEHLPNLLRQATNSLNQHCSSLTDGELTISLKLCSKILSRVLPSMTPLGGTEPDSKHSSPFKQAGGHRYDLEDGQFSGSDIFLSADSDTGDLADGNERRNSKDIDIAAKELIVSQMKDDGPKDNNNKPKDTLKVDSPLRGKKTIEKGEDTISETISFNEFVQYEEKSEPADLSASSQAKPEETPVLERVMGLSGSQTLMQACIQAYQRLFYTILSSRIVSDKETAQYLLQQLLVARAATKQGLQDYPLQLNSLPSDGKSSSVRRMKLQQLSSDTAEAFVCTCQLLVEFSSFPIYCTDYHKVLQNTFKAGQTMEIPDWLEVLITCCCFVDSFDIKSTAISTMLDLISLTQSVVEESEHKEEGEGVGEEPRRSVSEGTVSVVIIPPLSPPLLQYLNNSTHFYKIVATNLWDELDEGSPECHGRTVDLLYQLHQLAPNAWVCEDVIGNSMLSDDKTTKIAAYKKFTVLWHLLREKTTNNPRKPVRTFDRGSSGYDKDKIRDFNRSMFLMLDSLQSDTHPCRALAQTWLTHSLQRGDVARLLEPLLLILLHPDTARISIQHVNIHQPKRVRITSESSEDPTDGAETKIYAISSEGGNIIYHVSNQGKVISNKNAEDLRTFALATISDEGTKTSGSRLDAEMHFDRVNPDDLNLRVNPFGGSQSSLEKVVYEGYEIPPKKKYPELQNVRRLNAETCKKEGIFFDEDDTPTESNGPTVDSCDEAKEEGTSHPAKKESQGKEDTTDTKSTTTEEGADELTVDDIVTDVMEELLDRVMSTAEMAGSKESVYQDSVDGTASNSNRANSERGRRSASKDSLFGPDIMISLDGKIDEIDSQSDTDMDGVGRGKPSWDETPSVHPLHTHILLYAQKYDSQRTLYALSCLKAILSASPRLLTCALATTNVSSTATPHLIQLQNLLVRHRRSVFGKNFFSDATQESLASYRSSMFVEVLLSICLYFMRSYYPNLMMSKLTDQELNGNKEVQILSSEILTLLLSELVNVAKDSGKGFATYISDLLSKCKTQKALLHCVLASVYNSRKKTVGQDSEWNITEAIISFNEENMDANTNETFQVKLLKLLLVVVVLEDQIRKSKCDVESISAVPPEWEKSRGIVTNYSLSTVRYVNGHPIVYQSMLLAAMMNALKQQHLSHMHRHWLAMLTSSMPYLGRALSHTVVSTVNQLCRNLELLAQLYELGHIYRQDTGYRPDKIPSDHVVSLLESLTTICHYCLLENAQQDISIGQPLPAHVNSVVSDTANTGQIFSNLIHVFSPYGSSRESSPANEVPSVNPVLEARRHLLGILPRVLASIAVVWKAIQGSERRHSLTGQDQSCWTIGVPKTVKQFLLEFVSPISVHHGVNLMAAIAVVWNDRRLRGTKRVLPSACEDQMLLVDMVSAIKVLPVDSLIQTVKQVLKQPPPTSLGQSKRKNSLEVSLLQFFYAYIERTANRQIQDTWPSLLSLLREALLLNLAPPGQFLLLAILNEFIQKIGMFEEKKDQKDLQEIVQKLLEACSEIAGSSLEQTTFFRRNLAVKPGPQVDVTMDLDDTTTDQEGEEPAPKPVQPKQPEHNYRQYSVQALVMLAELTATLLDVVYRSEEKERVTPLLHSIMHNVFPYLKNHNPHNLPSFRACSQMLGSLSSYQYTRKAWKKEAFELLLDSSFFQMDETCLVYWRTVIDNLMTHDKTTFKDLLTRVSVTQGASLSLFSSRDQEFEQRALLLKRLSFTIFCSEIDQYQRFMPDIQERLADSLRMPSVPSLQAQVFMCFRVLILRISPQHVTSLWPTIITELVHVLLQVEQEISPDVDETKNQMSRLSNLDPGWTLGTGLNGCSNPSWLKLYMAACKLLDLCLVLQADSLPQFQLYRWAFIGDPGSAPEPERRRFKDQLPSFVPHVIRIARLMNAKFGSGPLLNRVPGRPLLQIAHIRSVQDLHAFFNTISVTVQSGESLSHADDQNSQSDESRYGSMSKSRSVPEFGAYDLPYGYSNGPITQRKAKNPRAYIEQMIEADFLEQIPRS